MAEEREGSARARAASGRASWMEIVSSTIVIGATGAVLLTGLALRSEPPRERSAPGGPVAPAPDPPPQVQPPPVMDTEPPPLDAPETAPPPVAAAPLPAPARASAAPPGDPRLDALAQRAFDDVDRIKRARGSWTAQVVVACKPETVSRCVASAKGSAKLYVLPAELNGEACFRVCWGSYPSAKEAAACKDLPQAMRAAGPVRSAEIAKVLP